MVEMRKRTSVNAYPYKDEDEVWEDIPTENISRYTPRSLGPQSPGHVARARQRRAQSRAPIRTQQPQAQTVRPHTQQAVSEDHFFLRAEVNRAVKRAVTLTVRYVGDVLTTPMVQLMHWPLALVLFLCFSAGLVMMMTLGPQAGSSPHCVISEISSTSFRASLPIHVLLKPCDGLDKLTDAQGSTFEHLTGMTVNENMLNGGMSDMEPAMIDLVQQIKASKLKSKDSLVCVLFDLASEGGNCAMRLQYFRSMINGSIDSIVTYNDHSLKTISQAKAKASSALRHLNSFLSAPSKDAIVETFTDAMSALSIKVGRLNQDGNEILESVKRLDEHLLTMYDITLRQADFSAGHIELLSTLWTKMNGSEREIHDKQKRLLLLKYVIKYCIRARAQVTGVLRVLETVLADMNDLRERAVAPELLGTSIPVEVHMKSLQGGIERMREGARKVAECEAVIAKVALGFDETLLN